MNIRKIILEEIRFSLLEGIEHMQNLYKSWANKKSGNPEAAMKIMDDVIENRRSLPKKDFANYTSYDELLKDLNQIKKSKAADNVTKFYEDKDLLVMAANTWEASCKYGAGSKWCTTARDTSSYWRRHNQTGTEFFWIFKNKPESDPNHKFSYHIKINGDTDWCNAVNNCRNELPEDSYPKQNPNYDEIIAKLKKFHDSRELDDEMDKGWPTMVVNLNRVFISNWVATNIDEILSHFPWVPDAIENVIYGDAVDAFMSGDAYDIIPLNVDVDEWEENYEMQDDFYSSLDDYLMEQKFDYKEYLNMLVEDLAWVVSQILYDDFDFDSTISIEEQMEEQNMTIEDIVVSENFEDSLEEIINEVYLPEIGDKLYSQAVEFARIYQP